MRLALAVVLAALGAGGTAMAESDLRVACIAEGEAAVPEGLCAALAARLGGTPGVPAGARLVVEASGPGRLSGRLDWALGTGWVAGESRTALVADAVMGPGVWDGWIEAVIAASPRPQAGSAGP